MYSCLTPAHFSDGGVTRRIVEILTGGQFVVESLAGLIHNIFEEVAPQMFLDLGWIQQHTKRLGAKPFPSYRRRARTVRPAIQRK